MTTIIVMILVIMMIMITLMIRIVKEKKRLPPKFKKWGKQMRSNRLSNWLLG